jgi:hypothetical protein
MLLGVNGMMGQQVIGSFPAQDGGFEGQTAGSLGSISSTSTWWLSTSLTGTINSTGGRSGPKSANISMSGTSHRTLRGPATQTFAAATAYVIQFYYKGDNNNDGTSDFGDIRGGINGSGFQYGSYTTNANTGSNWVKYTASVTPGAVTSAGHSVVSIVEVSSKTADFDIDDVVIYAGSSADVSAANSPGTVTVNNPTTTSLDVSWVAASGGVDGGGYVVVRYSSSPNADNDPNQNGIYAVGNTHTNGTGSLTGTVRYIGTGTSFTDNAGLAAGTQYWYKVYTVDKAFNYSAESSGNGTTTSSSSSSSNIILNSGFTHPTNIDYAAYQTASTLTTGNSIEVGQFDIQDGGGSSDADALATTLTACSLTVVNSANIRALALFDGSTNVGEITTVGATAVFSSLTLAAADDGNKTFSVRATFKSTVIDNQQISFTVASATASGAGSSFTASNAGAAATTTIGDNNKIEVATTDIIFDQNPTNVSQNAVMSPSPTVRALDDNANYDLDNTSNVALTISTGSTIFDGSATTTVAMVAGVATFNNLVFATAASTNQLTATQGAFTDVSSNFNVTAAAPEINVKQSATSLVSGSGTYAAGSIVSGNSGSAVTFTIENLGSANLTYSSITNSNTTDFTLDLTSTSTPIAASGSTTFTVAFNPTTAGAKSTTITINNNDADEGTYTFTVTGTGTVSATSDIITNSGYSYSSNIDYASNQTATTLTTGNSVGVNGLIIQDGAGAADADNLGTTLTAISFTTGGSTAIRTAALFDGSTNVSEVAVNGATTISFSSLTLSATDASTKNFELRVTYQASVTDNQQITFTVSSATASSTTSGFAAANAGAAASTTTGDINRLEVTASALAFVVQPANTSLGSAMTNVTVSANDGNGNRDLDFTSSVRITSTGTLTGTPVDVSASSGLATFTSLTHTAPGSSLTLNAERTSGLDWDVASSTFNITIQAPGLLLLEDNFTHSAILTSNGYTVNSGTGTNNLTAGATGLTYSNYGSSNIGNALSVANVGQDVYRTFTQQNSSTTVYASFLVNVSAALTGDYIFALAPYNLPSTYRARTFIKASSNSGFINFGISNAGSVNYNSTPTDYAVNTTHLVVVKYTFTSATTATATVFVNPSTSSEPSSGEVSFTDNTGANAPADINSFTIRQGSNTAAPTLVLDGIRIATNWGTLVGNPYYNSSLNIAEGNYNNINVLSGTLTATGNVSINGTTTNDGVISIGANTLSLNGDVSGSGTITGGTTSNLTIGGAAGTISFTSGGRTLNSLIIGTGNNASMSLGSALDITPTGGITFNAAGTKSFTTTGQTLTLKSAGTGTAYIGNINGTTVTGSITVERYIASAGRRWRFLSSPVQSKTIADWRNQFAITGPGTTTNTTVGDLNSNGWHQTYNNITNATPATTTSVRRYVEASSTSVNLNAGWADVTTGTALTAGQGFRTFIRGPISGVTTQLGVNGNATNQAEVTLSLSGTINSGDIAAPSLTYNQTGWNLLGNPYPCSFDWNAFHDAGRTISGGDTSGTNYTKIGAVAYIYDGTSNSYKSYSAVTNSGTLTSGIIPSGAGFFVQATSATPALTFKETYKTTSAPIALHKTTMNDEFTLKFLKDEKESDEIIVKMLDGATLNKDGYDINKLENENLNLSAYGTDGKLLTLSSIPFITEETRIKLNVEATEVGTYKFDFTNMDNFDAGVSVSLYDRYTNTTTDVKKNTKYTFNMGAGVNQWGKNRFELILNGKATTGVNENTTNVESTTLSVYPNPATDVLNISLSNGTAIETVNIYNISGKLVNNSKLNGNQIDISQLNNGVYMLEVLTANGSFKTKFVK